MLVVTKLDISFQDFDNNFVRIPAGTSVVVDEGEGIAYYNGNHFTIEPSEYVNFDADDNIDQISS